MVVNKPAGLASHPGPRGGASVEDMFPLLSRRKDGPWLAHRLDTDTAGCLLIALRKSVLIAAQAAFAEGRAGKVYWAVAAGDPKEDSGLIDAALRKVSDKSGWRMAVDPSGDAAITAWRDLFLPALAGPEPPALWPFDGDFLPLLARGGVVVAETYPAEAMRHFSLRMGGSKRRQSDRAALAGALAEAMAGLDAVPDTAMQSALTDGFGADAAGEDRFDSVLGLLCVLNVIAGRRPDGIPDDPWLRRWEGFVLGQTALPREPVG